MSVKLLKVTSSQVWTIACGNCVPRSTKTKPFRAKVSTRHTLEDTMFMREIEGPIACGEITLIRPATTTAIMPLT